MLAWRFSGAERFATPQSSGTSVQTRSPVRVSVDLDGLYPSHARACKTQSGLPALREAEFLEASAGYVNVDWGPKIKEPNYPELLVYKFSRLNVKNNHA